MNSKIKKSQPRKLFLSMQSGGAGCWGMVVSGDNLFWVARAMWNYSACAGGGFHFDAMIVCVTDLECLVDMWHHSECTNTSKLDCLSYLVFILGFNWLQNKIRARDSVPRDREDPSLSLSLFLSLSLSLCEDSKSVQLTWYQQRQGSSSSFCRRQNLWYVRPVCLLANLSLYKQLSMDVALNTQL